MRNTGIRYAGADRTPVILPEMAELLPALSGEQLNALEADLLKNGCYSPIIVNEDLVVIDGHHRQKLCEKNNIPYEIAVFAFDDLLEAKQWALDTQKAKRNLSAWELGQIALRLRPDIEARAQENLQEYHGNQYDSGPSATLPKVHSEPVDTRKELAEAVGLGERTMGKVMQIDEHAPAAVKEALDKKEMSINQGYNLTKQLQKLPEEQRDQAAQEAVDQARKDLHKEYTEADQRGRISKQFSKAFEKAVRLEVTEENLRIWTECARMTPGEIEENAQEARELAEQFSSIAEILDKLAAEAGT